MHISEREFYASCSRLKSKQTKKRLQHKDLEKQLIQQHKRLRHIRKEQNNLGYINLVPPVQKGWKRFFILREDVSRLENALFFQELLGKINTTELSFRKDFKVKQKQKGKKVYVEKEQPFPVIELYELKKIKLTDKERTYFHFEMRYKPNWNCWRKVLAFDEPWRFVLKVAPNMITQVRIIDPTLIKEEHEIKNHLLKNNLISKMYKITDGHVSNYSNWKGHEKMKYKSLFKTESVSKNWEEKKN